MFKKEIFLATAEDIYSPAPLSCFNQEEKIVLLPVWGEGGMKNTSLLVFFLCGLSFSQSSYIMESTCGQHICLQLEFLSPRGLGE